MSIPQRTIVLGNEYDDTLRAALRESLLSLGAAVVSSDWGVAGSQEVERCEVLIGSKRLVIESETYIGLKVTGEAELTNLVEAMVKASLQRMSRPSGQVAPPVDHIPVNPGKP